MFKKICEMLDHGQANVSAEVHKGEVVCKPIGEPVLAMVESLKDVHQWQYKVSVHSYLAFYHLTHIDSGLRLHFTEELKIVDYSYPPVKEVEDTKITYLDWATIPEKEALVEAFKEFKKAHEAIEAEYRAMEFQAERMKFMEAFCKGNK